MRICWRVFVAAELHVATIGPDGTSEHAHECALPCPILSNERVDFAWSYGKVHCIEGDGRAVALRDANNGKRGH